MVTDFDQAAALAVMARIAADKLEWEDAVDTIKWLDRGVIHFHFRFGVYDKDAPDSFKCTPEIRNYMQFMWSLRRSHVVQVGGLINEKDPC